HRSAGGRNPHRGASRSVPPESGGRNDRDQYASRSGCQDVQWPGQPASGRPCTLMETSAFLTTRWTLVRNAHGDTPEAREALQELCTNCYAPVVAFLRREGRDEESARDLAHEFFAQVLAG